jgi:hypothetical protein
MNPSSRVLASLSDAVLLQHALAAPLPDDLIDVALHELADAAQRAATVRTLWGAREPRVRQQLAALLERDRDVAVRHACVLAASIDPEFPVPSLVHATADPAPLVRAAALHALRPRRDLALAAVAQRALDDVDAEVVAAARALAHDHGLALREPAPLPARLLTHLQARGAALLGGVTRIAQALVATKPAARVALGKRWRTLCDLLDDRVLPATASRGGSTGATGGQFVVVEVFWDGPLPLHGEHRVELSERSVVRDHVRAHVVIHDPVLAEHLALGHIVLSLRVDNKSQEVTVAELPARDPATGKVSVDVVGVVEGLGTRTLDLEAWRVELFHRAWCGGDATSPPSR